MKKNTKLAAVFTTAALLAFGASMTSMAASKGTWKMDGNDWMCYDKNGDPYESTFCLSNGKEYYVGDDGYLARSQWVDYDGDMYYVNSAGEKVVNDWKFVTPYDDEDAEEEWFYFQSSGKAAESKKLRINNKTYFFDSDCKMLTGWVKSDSDEVSEASDFEKDKTYYTDETGARLENAWIKSTEPGSDDDDDDEYWYYLKSDGDVATGKKGNIKGQTYFFNELGQMQTGWVVYDTTTSGSKEYKSISGEDSDEKLSTYKNTDVYFCGGEDDGHAKKDKWVKTWAPADFDDQDADDDQNWYYIENDGKVFIPAAGKGDDAIAIELKDGHYEEDEKDTITSKKINSKDYYFNEEAEMVSGFYLTDLKGNKNMIYLGEDNDGVKKTGSFSVKDDNENSYKFYFESSDSDSKKGYGITGNKNGKLYYKGQLVTAEDDKYEIAKVDGKYYIINKSGSIQTSDKVYTEDGTDLFDASDVTFSKESGADKGSFTDLTEKLKDTKTIDVAEDYLILEAEADKDAAEKDTTEKDK